MADVILNIENTDIVLYYVYYCIRLRSVLEAEASVYISDHLREVLLDRSWKLQRHSEHSLQISKIKEKVILIRCDFEASLFSQWWQSVQQQILLMQILKGTGLLFFFKELFQFILNWPESNIIVQAVNVLAASLWNNGEIF